eukprot:1393300-Amorphochlora_amoeboformis.AAC.2
MGAKSLGRILRWHNPHRPSQGHRIRFGNSGLAGIQTYKQAAKTIELALKIPRSMFRVIFVNGSHTCSRLLVTLLPSLESNKLNTWRPTVLFTSRVPYARVAMAEVRTSLGVGSFLNAIPAPANRRGWRSIVFRQ